MTSTITPDPAASTTATVLGLPVQIVHESGRIGSGLLRPFKVREFPDILPLVANEMGLIERSLGVMPGSLAADPDPISGESYTALAESFHTLNAPFFAFCTRHFQMTSRVQGRAMERAIAHAIERHLSNSGAGSPG